MTNPAPLRILLGPQSPTRTVGDAVAGAALPDGPFAVISAAWQEAEADVGELAEVVGRPLEDLRLYARAEALFAGDDGLAHAARLRQRQLQEQQRLYRLRLRHLSLAARQILRAEGDAALIAAERRHAIAQLRALDRHHLQRCEAIWREFETAFDAASHPQLGAHANEIAATIRRCAGVIITGGNVAILINRLRLFGLARMLADTNIVAWSAGAMALTRRIVLYHDRSPEGRRDAEVLGAGCGIVRGLVVLPDARHRLRQGDRGRIELMSRRFSPDACVTLDNDARLQLASDSVVAVDGLRQLDRSGRLTKLKTA